MNFSIIIDILFKVALIVLFFCLTFGVDTGKVAIKQIEESQKMNNLQIKFLQENREMNDKILNLLEENHKLNDKNKELNEKIVLLLKSLENK